MWSELLTLMLSYESILVAWQLTKKQEVFKGTEKFKSEKLGTHLQSDEGFCVVLVLLVCVLRGHTQ